MTPYEKLKAHLDRHQYKRGAFTGDAPADSSRRGKNHFRVAERGSAIAVRMYSTDILTVTPDNRITLNTNGWRTSTTKENLNVAMTKFLGWGCVFNQTIYGLSQPTIRVYGKTYRFYDGMEFDAEGRLLSPAQFFERKQTDRAETAEFRKNIEESGFKAVWPVLFATAEAGRVHFSVPLKDIVTNEYHANRWPDVATRYRLSFDDHKKAYAALVRECTRGMTEIVKTDVTVIV